MVEVHPTRIPGRWREGFALDRHTLSSTYLGEDEFGRSIFDTKRSPLGDLVYRLKYQSDESTVSEIVDVAAAFVSKEWDITVDAVVPVPASRFRAVQPVALIGEALAQRLRVPFLVAGVTKARDVPELKNVHDYDERTRLLSGAHLVDATKVSDKHILLFDDLYRSGATMNAISAALYDQGGAGDVFALALTKTRSKR